MKIEGQAALVTGGASGLGEATARELARRGAKVAVLDRNGEGAKRWRPRSSRGDVGRRSACACDITDDRQRRSPRSTRPPPRTARRASS